MFTSGIIERCCLCCSPRSPVQKEAVKTLALVQRAPPSETSDADRGDRFHGPTHMAASLSPWLLRKAAEAERTRPRGSDERERGRGNLILSKDIYSLMCGCGYVIAFTIFFLFPPSR